MKNLNKKMRKQNISTWKKGGTYVFHKSKLEKRKYYKCMFSDDPCFSMANSGFKVSSSVMLAQYFCQK